MSANVMTSNEIKQYLINTHEIDKYMTHADIIHNINEIKNKKIYDDYFNDDVKQTIKEQRTEDIKHIMSHVISLPLYKYINVNTINKHNQNNIKRYTVEQLAHMYKTYEDNKNNYTYIINKIFFDSLVSCSVCFI